MLTRKLDIELSKAHELAADAKTSFSSNQGSELVNTVHIFIYIYLYMYLYMLVYIYVCLYMLGGPGIYIYIEIHTFIDIWDLSVQTCMQLYTAYLCSHW